jgi:hypothetical protein
LSIAWQLFQAPHTTGAGWINIQFDFTYLIVALETVTVLTLFHIAARELQHGVIATTA